MAMDRATKAQWQDRISERLDKATCIMVAEYSGLTVAELTELRVQLRKANSEFRVSKNRLIKRAIEAEKKVTGFKALLNDLKGPTGAVFVYGDVAQAAKSVVKFIGEHENLKLKSAVMDGQAIGYDQLKAVSDLPTKEVLLGQMLGSISAPARGIVTVMSGVARNLVGVINAIKNTKQA